MTQPHVWPSTEADHVMPSQVLAATANSPSSSAPAPTVHHAGSSASTRSGARTARRRESYQPRSAWVHGVPSLWTLPRSPSAQFRCGVSCHSSVYHDETLIDRFSCIKATRAASSGRRSSTPHTTFPHRGIRGADGISIWPTGVLLTVCEHTHPHTANILSTRSQQRRWVVQH